jgi:polyisoprenoid-binding protein YceI
MLKAIVMGMALMTAAAAAGAQGTVRLVVAPESKLWLEGGSNVHDWSCKAQTVDVAIDVAAEYVTKKDLADVSKLLKTVQVKVPVASIKCGKDGMDKNLYKALKQESAPTITYVMSRFDVVAGDTKDAFTVKAQGKLTVAGVEKPVTMDVKAIRLANGSVKATGTLPMLMTDFGIKPPTAMLGAMKTKNELSVKFDLVVGSQAVVAERDR